MRRHLHLAMVLSPVAPRFREQARKFPIFFKECCIDWFLPWSENALLEVAEHKLKRRAYTRKLNPAISKIYLHCLQLEE